jgi:acetyl esterase
VTVRETFAANAGEAHRRGLQMLREAISSHTGRADPDLAPLDERRNIEIPGPGGPLKARLYAPTGSGGHDPLLLFFHGGGFVLGDIESHDPLCHRLAQAGHIRVLSCEYRLAPEHAFPAQVEDALAAARWVIGNTDVLGADPARLGIGGDSAGGYLAITTASALCGAFKAQVLLYPLLHLEDELWANTLAKNSRAIGRLAVRYINRQLAAGAPPSLLNGPCAAISTLIATGGVLDPCAPDAIPFAERLRELGAEVTLKVYPNQIHGFGNQTHTFETARRATHEIGELAGELLRA